MTTTEAVLDVAVAELQEGERTWARTSLAERRDLLDQVHRATAAVAAQWVDAAAGIKGLPADSPLLGEEWLSGPYSILTACEALAATLQALEQGRSPVDGFTVTSAPGGRTAVDVLPHSVFDKLLLSGFTAQVWTVPGIDERTLKARAGLGSLDPTVTHGVAGVLGAGNISSIPPLDTLYQLYADNRVVLLKLNPVTDPLLETFRAVFAPLIDHGVVRIVTGGAETGGALVAHEGITTVHMTGSARTHDAIVFGTGPEGAQRKAENRPMLDKPITSELGGVSPTIVIPGAWSDADLRFQAEHLATQRLHNNGYNCVASQVAVISADWPQKQRFLDELRSAFQRAPQRADYYPGSADRVAAARAGYPDAQAVGPDGARTLVFGLKVDKSEAALHTEYFAPVYGVLELPGDAETFLANAVRTANDEFEGTLGVNIVADPKTISALGATFEQAIADLRYGTVAVNAWTGMGYLTARATWGAFPGHTIDDVQSGIGVVHNALLLDDVERTVVRGPFRPSPRSFAGGEFSMSPKPPWFVTNRTGAATGRLLTEFGANPSWLKLPGIFASALRG